MINGNKSNGNRNGKLLEVHDQFLQEQLMDAQQSLFYARSVREARFLQSKITFLKQRLNEIKGTNGKRR